LNPLNPQHSTSPIALKRGIQRDKARLGGELATKKRYLERYHKASLMYIKDCMPISKSQVIVHNNDFYFPELMLLKNS